MTEEATLNTADISAALDNSSETTEPQASDTSNTQEPNSQNQDAASEGVQEDGADKPKFDNLEAALKGYANLEKKLGEQSNELGELRKQAEIAKQLQQEQLQIAKNYGFNSVEDFRNAQIQSEYDHKLAEYEAD